MKQTLKKLLSLTLAGAMMFSMGITAFANEGIATAYLENEDGTIESLPINYSIKILPNAYTRNGVERRYALEASARSTEKTEDGSKTDGGVTATLTLYWTDHLGTENEITGLSGGWTEDGGTVTGGRKVFGQAGTSGFTASYYPTDNSFEYYGLSKKALTLRGHSQAKIKTASGTSSSINLTVQSGF